MVSTEIAFRYNGWDNTEEEQTNVSRIFEGIFFVARSFAVPVGFLCVMTPQFACASFFTQLQGLNAADNSSWYDVLYTGGGGNQLSITNVTVNGNIGVGGTGTVQFNGPGTINGTLGFNAANTGQYTNTNAGDVGPTSIAYSVGAIAADLSDLTSLSATLAGESGTSVAIINGTQTITVGTGAGQFGTQDANGNWIVDVSSVGDNAGQVLTINTGTGFTAGQTIVFDINGNANLQGDITLGSSLTSDQLVWNFYNNGTASLNNNQSSYPTLDWEGIILDPTGAVSLVNANLIGRVYGGDTHNTQIVSGDNITQPATATPEPSSLSFVLIGFLLGGFGFVRLRRRA
jgi:hypothetical protein